MMIEVRDQNLHGADAYRCPIGIECSCGRRALIPLERISAHRGSMMRIKELSLVCAECGSRGYRAFLFLRPQQADAFAQGQSFADVFDLRHAGLEPNDPRVVYWKDTPNPYRTDADVGEP